MGQEVSKSIGQMGQEVSQPDFSHHSLSPFLPLPVLSCMCKQHFILRDAYWSSKFTVRVFVSATFYFWGMGCLCQQYFIQTCWHSKFTAREHLQIGRYENTISSPNAVCFYMMRKLGQGVGGEISVVHQWQKNGMKTRCPAQMPFASTWWEN